MLDGDGKLLFGRDVTLSCYACHNQMCYVYVFYFSISEDLRSSFSWYKGPHNHYRDTPVIVVSLYYKHIILLIYSH